MRGGSILESLLGDIDYPKDSIPGKLYPFKVRVGCVKRRPPRHDYFQYILEIGRGHIKNILDGSSLGGSKHLTFIFPERWMNVAEQRSFMSIMKDHPEVNIIENVDILTSSSILLGSFRHEQMHILTWDDDKDPKNL